MNKLYKEIIKNEVFPAMGCTEPISVAYAAGVAATGLNEEIYSIDITVDQGTYKNGLAVKIPNTDGEKGNLIAGVLGALIAKPEKKMQILSGVTKNMLKKAKELIRQKKAHIKADDSIHHFYIEVVIKTKNRKNICIIKYNHTNIVFIKRDNKIVLDKVKNSNTGKSTKYKDVLKKMTIQELIDIAERITKEDIAYIKHGVKMNLSISREGKKLKKVGFYLMDLMKKKLLLNDILSSTKILTASAVDARMDGLPMPVMSSGGSGNQGIVASLVPYNVGKYLKISENKIFKSIALSHLINSYIKVFTGELAPICGCAIAAGVGAASAIVYQVKGADMPAITYAVNNVISDLGGMLCDGAKSGCALKVISSTDSAIRAAYLGIHYYGIGSKEGFIGRSAEETIQNLSKISHRGMSMVDDTIVNIMVKKSI